MPHVKTDFNKWVDEDEEEERSRNAAFDLAQLRDLSTYEHSTYEKDFYGEEEDSDDDDDMPDLEGSDGPHWTCGGGREERG